MKTNTQNSIGALTLLLLLCITVLLTKIAFDSTGRYQPWGENTVLDTRNGKVYHRNAITNEYFNNVIDLSKSINSNESNLKFKQLNEASKNTQDIEGIEILP